MHIFIINSILFLIIIKLKRAENQCLMHIILEGNVTLVEKDRHSNIKILTLLTELWELQLCA